MFLALDRKALWLSFLLSFVVVCASAEVFIADSVAADSSQLANRVHALQEYVLEQNRIVSQLTDTDLSYLPLGVEKVINGRTQYLLFDNLVITPDAAYVNVYVSLDFPIAKRKLAFAATKVKIHKGGIAASTGTKLTLLTDAQLPIGEHITIDLLSASGQNYIEWDCNGFKNLSINGMVTISPSTAEKADAPGQPVKAAFTVQAADPGSIIAQIDLPAFEVKQLPGFRFTISRATLDFSDDRNAEGFKLPDEYKSEYGTYPEFWTGVHFAELRIDLPKELSSGKDRLSLQARNMFIDRQGFTGAFTVEGLVNLEQGSLASWPFSIDKFYVVMLKNKLHGAEFNGELKLPLFDEPMDYGAGIYWNGKGLDYQVLVKTSETMHSDLLLADVVLDKNSVISIKKENGSFEAKAVLHGVVNMNGGKKITAEGLHFRNLTLSNKSPIIRGGEWGMKTEALTAGFPLQIDSIGLHHNMNDLALIIQAKLTIMGGSGGFSGSTTIGVNGEIEETLNDEGQATGTRFRFKDVKVHGIGITVKTSAYQITGTVDFFDDDPKYGNGFRGTLDAEIAGFKVEAEGTFGKKADFRYWMVEAYVHVNLPLGSSNFAIYKLGGGLFYHMKQSPLPPGGVIDNIDYEPDKSVSLGFNAGVTLGMIPDPYVFNADAFFEIAFSSSGGVKYMQFRGDAFFMTPMEKREAGEVKLNASMMMMFDFENKIFHSTLEIYINIFDILKGVGTNDLAGWAEMYFSPDEWFIHIGRPDKRIGLAFVALGNQPLVTAESYFMAGHRIPDIPELPAEVTRLTGEMSLSRDDGALASAKGMAFGTSLKLSTGKINFLVFYGEIGAGLGFDVMLRDLSNYTCGNTGDTPGINGWYASGQAWAYIMAEIGIKVDLRFIKGEFPILQLGLAAALQAELPNPIFMQGAVAGEFNILGGLVSGKCKFKFSFGEKCEIVGTNSVTGVKAIGQIKPVEGDKEVDVFTKPQVSLNVAEGTAMEILNNDNDFKFYRIKMQKFEVTHNGAPLKGELVWNEARTSVVYKTESILPPQEKIEVLVQVVWQERVSSGWKNLSQGGKDEIEEEKLTFITGEAPDYIPEDNIVAGYPYLGQYSFHPKETNSGYILLDTDQEYLFTEPGMKYEMNFVSTSQASVKSPVSYDRGAKKVSFALPELATETAYKMVLVREPENGGLNLESNINTEQVNQLNDEGGNNVNVQQTSLMENLVVGQGFNLYENYFRTSRYAKFLDKLNDDNAFSFSQMLAQKQYKRYGLRMNLDELFEETEVRGNNKFKRLVLIEAIQDYGWYKNFAGPTIYNNYPVHHQAIIEWREVDEDETRDSGVPPDQPIIVQQETFPSMSEDEVNMGAYTSQGGQVDIMHDWDFYGYYDYYDIKNNLVNLNDNELNTTPIRRVLTGTYQYLYANEPLQFLVQYRLPGTDIITSKKILTIDINK
ncbi:hypothetical protein LVD15_03690 [Fulvivirga maritima]|uniref:hypothetical protein n=1 Tax=Fulvivirga maritima TaxID=2904247 RepID=UPI001F2E58BC|nr:hypothetical protein [Fulvivirga maritima]UII27546.1 hypothetical protein LVD15_03690 [Fulvivirga maritima]